MAKERCSETVSDREIWHVHQCLRNGVVQREGKWYCKQHDPVAIKKRDAIRIAKYEKVWEIKEERWRREAAMKQACDGISTDDLERLEPGDLATLLAKEADDGS